MHVKKNLSQRRERNEKAKRGSATAGRETQHGKRCPELDANNRRRCLGTRFHSSQVINWSHTADYLIPSADLYTGAKKTGPTGQTGDYFAKIAPSSQKAAPLICLRSRGSGASHNHLRSSLAPGAILPPWKQRERVPAPQTGTPAVSERGIASNGIRGLRPATARSQILFARSIASPRPRSLISVFLPPRRGVTKDRPLSLSPHRLHRSNGWAQDLSLQSNGNAFPSSMLTF